MDRSADRIAAGLSTLCVLHCLAGGIAVVALTPLEPVLGHGFHEIGLLLAMPLAAYALVRGWLGHGRALPVTLGLCGLLLMLLGLALGHSDGREFALTAAGAGMLAAAHLANLRFTSAHAG